VTAAAAGLELLLTSVDRGPLCDVTLEKKLRTAASKDTADDEGAAAAEG